MQNLNTAAIQTLSFEEIDAICGSELTAREVAETGLVAIAVAPATGPAAPLVAAVGATAVLIGGLIAGMDAG